MSRGRLARIFLLCCLLTASLAGGANGALVAVEDLVLRADGSYHPNKLPRREFVPIRFQGFFNIAAKGGGKPATLHEVDIDFDRDGRLSVGGLPTCAPSRIETATPAEARQACEGAIVGSGRIEALVETDGGVLRGASPLTIFNGPRTEGKPTVVLHAQTTFPTLQTFAVLVPIEQRPGEFRYRAHIVIPPIAEGRGAITRIEAKVGRKYSAAGKQRSYVSAHCSDGILRTHGHFYFADGRIVDGAVEKGCTPR